jgi:hypothetical protein
VNRSLDFPTAFASKPQTLHKPQSLAMQNNNSPDFTTPPRSSFRLARIRRPHLSPAIVPDSEEEEFVDETDLSEETSVGEESNFETESEKKKRIYDPLDYWVQKLLIDIEKKGGIQKVVASEGSLQRICNSNPTIYKERRKVQKKFDYLKNLAPRAIPQAP